MNEERSRKGIYKNKDSRLNSLHTTCTNCGVDVPFDSVDLDNNLAACYNCQQFFEVKENAVGLALKAEVGQPVLAIPQGIDVLETDEKLDIRYSKLATESKGKIVFLSIFSLFWNGFLFIMIRQLLERGDMSSLLFMSLHIIAGIFLFLWLTSTFLNHVDVIVNNEKLLVKTRPLSLPFLSDVIIYPDDIDQLYVEKYISSTSNNSPNYAYKLFAILKNEKSQIVLKDASRKLCFYLEQSIERRLGIEDRYIKGQEN